MKYTCLVLFLVLLLRTTTQSTIYVDNIDYNYVTTEVPTFVSETSNVVLADAGRFTLEPASGISIETTGPVQLVGSFVHIQSDASITQNAGGSFTLDGADSFSVLTTNLNITSADDFSITTVGDNLEVNVGGNVEALVDQAYIVGEGSVTINSGGGNVELFSDHIVQVMGQNTNILGENRVTFESLYDVSIDAVNSFESRSNLLDFNTLGDIRITSTTNNVKFVAGSELILEAETINFEADEGIDVTSLHGDIFVNSARDLYVTSLDTVDFEIIDDANFITENGPVSVKSSNFTADAHDLIHLDATDLSTSSESLSVNTVVTKFDTHGSIQFTFTGNGVQDSVFHAEDDLQITTNFFNSASDTLLINTQDSDPTMAGDIIFQTNSIDESTFTTTSIGDLSFDADFHINLYAGSIDNSGDNIQITAESNLNINAEYKTFDFINMKSDIINWFSSNTEIAGNIAILESSNDMQFVHTVNMTLNGGLNDGTVSFDSSDRMDFDIGNAALFQSRFDNKWSSYSYHAALQSSVNSQVLDDTQFFSKISNFVASNGISASSHFIKFVTDSSIIRSTIGDISFSSDNFNFWANEAASIDANAGATFNFIDDITFRSFADLTIDNLVSLFAQSFLGFESNEEIEVFATNIYGNSSSIDLITNARSNLNWIGTNFFSSSDGTYFTAPSSSYSSLDDLSFSSGYIDIESILEYPIYFQIGQVTNITTDDGSNFVNSDNDVQFIANDDFRIDSTTGSITTSAGVSIVQQNTILNATPNNLLFSSDSDVTIAAPSGSLSVDTIGDMTWNVNRDSVITVGEDFVIDNEDSVYNVDEFNLNSNAPSYYENGQIHLEAGTDMDITLSGSFSQNGGSVVYTIGGTDNVAATSVLSINSIDGSTINVSNGNITFDSTPANSTIRFQSMDFVVNAALTIDFLAGDLTISSNKTQQIIFDSAHNITINTNNDKAFTWTSRDDINSTIGNFTVRANRKDSEGNSISFKTTDDEGNFIVNVRSGWLNFQSRDSQTYSANFIELFAANDLTFNTSLALSPNTGGITFTTDGFSHNPVAGEKTGITFTATGLLGYIYLDAPAGKESYHSGYDMSVNSKEGDINVLANQQIQFTSTQANILINSADHLSFITDTGDITFQTSEGNTEFRASSNINLSAATNIYLTSTDPITKTNGRAFEFAASSGHINVYADSDSNINWIAGGDFYTQSAETTTQFGSEGIFYTAENGHYLASSKTGIKLLVQNGDMNFNASDSINFSSGNNWDIFVSSGQSSYWTAQSKNIEISAAENTTIRTERNNILFQTEVGNIFIDSTGQIRIQADGTDSNPNGSNVDGVFVIAPNVDVSAYDKAIIESEALVTIGANTNPIVKFEAGGSAASTGFEMTAVGNIHFTIQEDVNINSGGDLYMEAVKEFDLQSTGSISITTTGTDATGKDFVIRTLSEMDVNAVGAFINGQDAVNILSFESIKFQTTGTDPVSSNIEISAALDFTLEVDDKMDINSGDWITVAEEQFEIVVLGDLYFSNYFPSTTGQIYIYGDSSLDFEADTFLNVISTGVNSNITLSTLGANSDLFIQTNANEANINFHTLSNFISESVNDVDFQTTESLVFSSFDNIDDDVESGKITFTTPDDFQSISNTLTLQGNQGASFTTINRADVQLQSAGSLNIEAYEKMLFESVNGKLSIAATQYLDFSTYPGQFGYITISTTRDLLISSEDKVTFDYGGDLTTTAQTINFDSNNGFLSVITEGATAEMSFNSETILLTGGEDSTLFGSYVNINTPGTALLHADSDMQISTIGNHAHISYLTTDLLSINAPQQINFYAYSGAGRASQFDYYDYYNHNGHGFINFTASGANPLFGYGMLVNSTNGMDIHSIGSVIFTAPLGNLHLQAATGITFTASTSIRDKKAVRISALGTDSKMYFNASQEIIINASQRHTVYADKSIQFYPYDTLMFSANANAVIDTTVGVEILSTHPNADIYMQTTDFLTGSITYNANGIEVYGERLLDFHLQDDDDADPVGTYSITSQYISFEAQNQGLIESIGGGDIVITASNPSNTGAVHIHAGDDFYVDVSEQIELNLQIWSVQTITPVSFIAPDDTLSQSSTAATSYDVGGDVIIASSTADLVSNSGNIVYQSGYTVTSSPPIGVSPQTTSLLAENGATLTSDSALISTQRKRNVDFIDGIIIPVQNQNVRFRGTSCTNAREFLYDTAYDQFCYCASNSLTWICAQARRSLFPY